MKRFIRKYYCKNVDDTLKAIEKFHETVTPEYCQRYIKKLKEVFFEVVLRTFIKCYFSKVIHIVIAKDGGWSNL